jgi:hypothetical protein
VTPPSLSGQKRTKDDISAASSVDGTMSALIPESSHVPPVYNHGAKRACFGWKVPIALSRISSQSAELQTKMHTMVNEFFRDDNGFIYDWNQEGIDRHNNVVSKLSPSELRTYLPSSISISAERQITVQVCFGFVFSTTPATKWGNLPNTKEKLE